MTTPYWIQDAIFYQIFPDRFANGDRSIDPANVQAWGSPPTGRHFQGGDLRGIIEHFDYLLDLGINTLYLNPIFLSHSNHRYNTTDYYTIDPRLGSMRDFRALLETAHSNGLRLILDGVFNHCGRSFFAFADLLENGEASPFRNWFHVHSFPLDAYSASDTNSYSAWWGIKSLPKFNTDEPAVRRYLLDVSRYWITQGIDGWRLDVPNEINDNAFWAEFREGVKAIQPDAYILGEIWTADPRWLDDQHFDGLMNYPLRDALLDLLGTGDIKISAFSERVEKLLKIYPRSNTYAMYNTLGSHDTERIFTRLGGNLDKVKLAFAFVFAFPGAPAIYYGDEIGLAGGKDPECRAAFPWDESGWQAELRAWVKSLISLRKRFPALRRGSYLHITLEERAHCYAFARCLGDENILIGMNASSTVHHMRIPVSSLGWTEGRILHDLLGKDEYLVSGDSIVVRIPAWSAIFLN
jgi:glycosidase